MEVGTTQVSIYDMQLQTKYKLLSELIWITDFIENISTQSFFFFFFFFFFALEIRFTVCSYGTSTVYFVTYVTIRGTMNYVNRKASVLAYFPFCNFRVCFNTKLHKNIPNVDFMAILMKLATCHVRNTFGRPLRPNTPTVRVLTSVILKGIGWAFRKLYPTKIPGMVHQGLLAPQRLIVKLGFTWVYLFFLFLIKSIDCGYSLEGGSNVYRQSMV